MEIGGSVHGSGSWDGGGADPVDPVLGLRVVADRLLLSDVGGLDGGCLHERIVALRAEQSRLDVVLAELLAEWDARRCWESNGSRSAAHRLARDTRRSVGSSRIVLSRARRIRHLGVARDAVVAGSLSIEQLDVLGHVNTPARRVLFERDEAVLVNACTTLSFAQSARMLRYWAMHADETLAETHDIAAAPTAPDDTGPDDADPDTADRSGGADGADGADSADSDGGASAGDPAFSVTDSRLHVSRTLDDQIVIDGVLDAIDGTVVEAELDRLAEAIRLADHTAGRHRTPAQRRAAALVEMARRSATTPANGRRPRPLFTALIGERSLDRLCELSNGTIVTPATLLPYLADAEIESVLFDGPSTIVAVSARRSFAGAVRRAVQVCDRRCQHPSDCDIPADRCDVDHIIAHAAHGPTSQFNGRLLCPTHNRHHHLRDPSPTPRPERTVDRSDELRVLIRWRCRNDPDLTWADTACTCGVTTSATPHDLHVGSSR